MVDGVRNFVEEGFGHDVREVEVADWEVEASGGFDGGHGRLPDRLVESIGGFDFKVLLQRHFHTDRVASSRIDFKFGGVVLRVRRERRVLIRVSRTTKRAKIGLIPVR